MWRQSLSDFRACAHVCVCVCVSLVRAGCDALSRLRLTEEVRELLSGMGSALIKSVKARDNWVFAGRAGSTDSSPFEKVSGPPPPPLPPPPDVNLKRRRELVLVLQDLSEWIMLYLADVQYCYCSLSLRSMWPLCLKGIIVYSAVNKSRSLEASSCVFLLISFSVVIFIACENGSVLAMKPHFCTDSDTSGKQNHTRAMQTSFGAF